ncbi:hypothetical protein SAMN04488023_106161 [Pedobacter rhizosphaerae]|uniref:Uncharacterized protein n=1 Tax=Pedobacter rhizosphaerae TaxID=390241 RepID=A0A1H9MUQ2_9SPHI|nr:hypothetical protein SAMN04488023_106161 [Pedobacter rhizosphaerae]
MLNKPDSSEKFYFIVGFESPDVKSEQVIEDQ